MLRGMRTAVKYFTLGLLAGVLLAPRKGDETRRLLVERGKEYMQDVMSATEQAAQDMKDQMTSAQGDQSAQTNTM